MDMHAEASLPTSTPQSILVVDDDERALHIMGVILRSLGATEVVETASAEHALDILADRRFDLVLADYRLEGMDGAAFAERLRSRGDETPILIVSGAPDKAGVIRAAHFPRVDFYGKPFRLAEFRDAIGRLTAS